MEFDEAMVEAVWGKARATLDQNPTRWRKDQCGAWLFRDHYGSTVSDYGWKIQNVSPGGDDTLENLKPFHHRNGFDIAQGEPRCAVTADRAGLAPEQSVGHPRNAGV